jgi:hypothetical protein
MKRTLTHTLTLALAFAAVLLAHAGVHGADADAETVRVFIFAGQSNMDVTANLAAIAAAAPAFIHVKAFDLPSSEEKLVITTAGIVRLGELLAESHLEHR